MVRPRGAVEPRRWGAKRVVGPRGWCAGRAAVRQLRRLTTRRSLHGGGPRRGGGRSATEVARDADGEATEAARDADGQATEAALGPRRRWIRRVVGPRGWFADGAVGRAAVRQLRRLTAAVGSPRRP